MRNTVLGRSFTSLYLDLLGDAENKTAESWKLRTGKMMDKLFDV